jgi:hypothetical protein
MLERVHMAGQQVVLASSASKKELDHYVHLLGAEDLAAEPPAPTTSKKPSLPQTSWRLP